MIFHKNDFSLRKWRGQKRRARFSHATLEFNADYFNSSRVGKLNGPLAQIFANRQIIFSQDGSAQFALHRRYALIRQQRFND